MRFLRLAAGFIIFSILLGLFDANPFLLLMLVIVGFSLFGTLRKSAKAAGRKTSAMFDPSQRDFR